MTLYCTTTAESAAMGTGSTVVVTVDLSADNVKHLTPQMWTGSKSR